MGPTYANSQPSGFKNRIENIAIVGAGGQVGKFIVDALLQKNLFRLTALSREGSTNAPAPGVKVVSVNYDKPETIVEALRGQDALLITMSVHAPRDQQPKLIRAAAEVGVPWIHPNLWGGDQSDEEASNDALTGPRMKPDRELIESLGKSKWVGTACSFWYEYSLSGPWMYGIDIVKREAVFFDEGKQRLHTTTWAQTGRAIAELFSLPVHPQDEDDKALTLSGFANRFVRISSFTLNQREMLDAVQRVTNTSDVDWKITFENSRERYDKAKKAFEGGNHRDFAVLLYTRYFFKDDAGLYRGKELDNERLGLPKEELDESTKKAVALAEGDYVQKRFRMF